jgi:hypothetical protein
VVSPTSLKADEGLKNKKESRKDHVDIIVVCVFDNITIYFGLSGRTFVLVYHVVDNGYASEKE